MVTICISLLPVNLQDGLLLADDQIVGGYNHKAKCVILFTAVKECYDLSFPETIREYKIINGWSDSVSLTYWTPAGEKSAVEIAKMYLVFEKTDIAKLL